MDDSHQQELEPTSEPVASLQATRRQFVRQVWQGVLVASASTHAQSSLATHEDRSKPQMGRWSTNDHERAKQDYRRNVEKYGGQLASPIESLLAPPNASQKCHFDVLIVGGGVSASVCAAKLAAKLKPEKRLGILERGREWVPGTFHESVTQLPLHVRHSFEQHQILQASGLGGSSLIHPIQSSVPNWEVLDQETWPDALHNRLYLANQYDEIASQLGLLKSSSLAMSSTLNQEVRQRFGGEEVRQQSVATSVARSVGSSQLPLLNSQGWLQRPCTDCGLCLQGCNYGALNGMQSTFLPAARQRGAEVFVQTTVHSFEKLIDHYRVHYTHHALAEDGSIHSIPGSTTTRILILAAGSVSTTEILLRSRSPHLRLSPRLGYDWNNNGSVLAVIEGHTRKKTDDPHLVSNLSRPQIGEITARKWQDRIQIVQSLRIPHDHRDVWMAIGHDPARGQLMLDDQGQITLHSSHNRSNLYVQRAKAELRRWASAFQSRAEFPKEVVGLGLYSLGGCIMSDDPQRGVVNHAGQVYDLSFGGDVDPVTGYYRVHTGLYAIGSATIPTTLGCSPHLTVAAIGARSGDLLSLDPQHGETFTL